MEKQVRKANMSPAPESVTAYLASLPPVARNKVNELRRLVKTVVPEAEEVISYGIIGYKRNGMLVYVAGYPGHVSVYPIPKAMEETVQAHKSGKSTLRFPLDRPLPEGLIKEVVAALNKANNERAALKNKNRLSK